MFWIYIQLKLSINGAKSARVSEILSIPRRLYRTENKYKKSNFTDHSMDQDVLHLVGRGQTLYEPKSQIQSRSELKQIKKKCKFVKKNLIEKF
jgi:hypothetical protein